MALKLFPSNDDPGHSLLMIRKYAVGFAGPEKSDSGMEWLEWMMEVIVATCSSFQLDAAALRVKLRALRNGGTGPNWESSGNPRSRQA
jgi:hypothetical protein